MKDRYAKIQINLHMKEPVDPEYFEEYSDEGLAELQRDLLYTMLNEYNVGEEFDVTIEVEFVEEDDE